MAVSNPPVDEALAFFLSCDFIRSEGARLCLSTSLVLIACAPERTTCADFVDCCACEHARARTAQGCHLPRTHSSKGFRRRAGETRVSDGAFLDRNSADALCK
eukprot:1080153-Pleurochrysis_carterae.AAC.1